MNEMNEHAMDVAKGAMQMLGSMGMSAMVLCITDEQIIAMCVGGEIQVRAMGQRAMQMVADRYPFETVEQSNVD